MMIISLEKSDNALKTLDEGGLVIFPSDTVYGLLVDATNEQAVKKLISFKNRPTGKPISVFTTEQEINKLVKISPQQRRILNILFPGPFTAVLKSKHRVSRLLESEKDALGVRIPDYQPINLLVKKFGKPITATSANLSGKSPQHSVGTLLKQLSDKKKQLIDLIIDGGKLPKNKPSTIVDLTTSTIRVIRKGDVNLTDTKTYLSSSPGETKKIAQQLLKENPKTRALIFILHGDLGVGKTVFVKGVGEALGINNIISPTFVVYYDYDVQKQDMKKLIHVDLYNLNDEEEFAYLGLEKYLQAHSVACFEWGEKAQPLLDLLRRKGKIIYVKMDYLTETKRRIKVSKLS